MIAESNLWWQGSKLEQCRLTTGAGYVDEWGSVHKDATLFDSSLKLTNQQGPTVKHSIRHYK